jgi:dipeptidyl aminopeptidase/acylaminoacyl peptidase
LIAPLLLLVLTAQAQPADSIPQYMTPAEDLVEIFEAPPPPWVRISPGRRWMLLMDPVINPPIEDLAVEEEGLAGLRIDTGRNAPARKWYVRGLTLRDLDSGGSVEVAGLPEGARFTEPSWSPDGSRLLLVRMTDVGGELWVLDCEEGTARALTGPVLSLAAYEFPKWSPDGESILFCRVPGDRGRPPAEPGVPAGPVVRQTSGRTSPARTYADLLETPHDGELFRHYLTSELWRAGLDGSLQPVFGPDMIWYFSPSPDGNYILVSTLHPPWSYTVPAYRFPSRVRIITDEGDPAAQLADLPLQEEVPMAFGSVPEGPRSFQWRADADATICWVEAMDGGDATAEAELRDRVLALTAPFAAEPETLATIGLRFGGIDWSSDSLALLSGWWWPTRTQRLWRLRPEEPHSASLLLEYSFEDAYADPGEPLLRRDSRGRKVLVTSPDGGSVYMKGDGATPQGDRPFLAEMDIESGGVTELFRSSPPYLERPLLFMDDSLSRVLVRRESAQQPPNYYVADLETGALDTLTDFPHPTPQLLGIEKELVTYEREDGLPLSAVIYLPPGYEAEDGPLPMLVWAYPQEYASADAAGQVRTSPHSFDRIGWWSPLIWLVRGYAVMDDPAMPIVADSGGQPNDTFLPQLTSSARAAVDYAVSRGIADPDRIAVGGHSYGAFMAANLLAHTDLFATGIARSGAYNRTLTPFGFQSEERSLWEAPDVYFRMSPFMHADSIDEPMLMVHGEEDTNSGTYPIQSERLFEALKGLGGTARLVMLPLEGHGYRARESVLHLLWETDRWLQRHLGDS